EVVLRVDGDAVDHPELTLLRPGLSPGLYEVSLLVELRDPRVAEPVGDVDIAGPVKGDIGRTVEICARETRPGRSCRAAAAFAASGSARPSAASRRLGRRAARTSIRWRCATGTTGPTRATARPHGNRFRFAAKNEGRRSAVRVELDHLTRPGVDDPDVVLCIDSKALRPKHSVKPLTDLLHEFAVLIELEEAGAAVVESPRIPDRGIAVAGSGVNENVP